MKHFWACVEAHKYRPVHLSKLVFEAFGFENVHLASVKRKYISGEESTLWDYDMLHLDCILKYIHAERCQYNQVKLSAFLDFPPID